MSHMPPGEFMVKLLFAIFAAASMATILLATGLPNRKGDK